MDWGSSRADLYFYSWPEGQGIGKRILEVRISFTLLTNK